MNVRMIWGVALALASVAAQSILSCGEAERLYDCAGICDGYADCIDDSVDRAACTTACESKGPDDSEFAEQASECEMCIDDESCADTAIRCTAPCAVVLAEST